MVEHVNRRGDTYFLHEGRTKTGKPKYFFSRKREGQLAATIPGGFEVHENPNGQVSLRKTQSRLVTDEEVQVVERETRKFVTHFLVDVKGKSIVVHTADETMGGADDKVLSILGLPAGFFRRAEAARFLTFTAVMRYTLADEQTRSFTVERYCFRGSIDDWIELAGPGKLETLVAKYCKHLGRESFFDLFGV